MDQLRARIAVVFPIVAFLVAALVSWYFRANVGLPDLADLATDLNLEGSTSPSPGAPGLLPLFNATPDGLATGSALILGVNDALVEKAIVARIVDGDTLELSDGRKLRYIGIDTPETKHPRLGVECFGKEAAARNGELVLNREVGLEKDVSEVDRYGRLLRYVWLDGRMVNEQLVAEGFAQAVSFPPDIKYQDQLRVAEAQARDSKIGLWSGCTLGN